MRIKYTNVWGKKDLSVEEAFQIKMDIDREGYVERAQSNARSAQEMLAQVIQMLHENGALKDDQILNLLGSEFDKI